MARANIIAWVVNEIGEIETIRALVALLEAVEADGYINGLKLAIEILEKRGLKDAAEALRDALSELESFRLYVERGLREISAYGSALSVAEQASATEAEAREERERARETP